MVATTSNDDDGHDELLLAVFRLKNRRPSDTQTAAFCRRLRDALGVRVRQWSEEDEEDEEDEEEDNDEEDGDDGPAESIAVVGAMAREIVPATTTVMTETAVHLDPLKDDRQTPLDRLSARDRAWLRRGWPQLLGAPVGDAPVGAVWTLEWFPAYAGVLQAEQVGVDTVALRVVALDKWEWTRHFVSSGECVHSAVSTKHVVLSCGSLDTASMNAFRTHLDLALATAKQRTGALRSAAAGEGASAGHQKTPQFLVAAVRTAIDAVAATPRTPAATYKPRGGMTDVGLHTGGAARDTCWPLVCAALRQSLPPSGALADKVLLVFSAALLEKELGLLSTDTRRWPSGDSRVWGHIDMCMEMLHNVAATVMALVDNGYEGSGWLVKCQRWRTTLDAAAARWHEGETRKYRLPDLPECGAEDTYRFPGPCFPPDQTLFDTVESGKSTQSSDTADEATQAYVFIDPSACSPGQLLKYVESLKPQDDAKKLVGLRAIETLLIGWSNSLTDSSLDSAPHPVEPATLLQLLTWYRGHQPKEFHDDESRRLEQHSMYVVLAWVTFCLAHRRCAEKFHDVAHYQIALDYHRLDVCVLRGRSARQSVLRVAQYIRDWNKRATGVGLFDLANHAGTLGLARRLGKLMYEDAYVKVQEKWHSKCQSTWGTISRRKDELQTVRQEITNYEASVRQTKASLAEEKARLLREWNAENPPTSDRWHYRGSPNLTNRQTGQYESEIRRLENVIRQKQGKRDRLRRMPEFVTSPLPFDKADALQVLCLMAPPADIDVLAELCWRAQRSLSPSASSTSLATASPGVETWRSHFEMYSGLVVGATCIASPAQHAIAYPCALTVPSTFGPMWIDDVWSEEGFVSSSSWFPGIANSTIHWRDDSSNGRWANPFLVDAQVSRELFTPRMSPRHGSDWQWAIQFPVLDALKRGNTTYAQWGQRVSAADQAEGTLEFCDRGALRSYPMQQVRRVFASLEGDSLDWSNTAVACLVRQALYQCGRIEEAYTPLRFAWHEDLEDEANVLKFCGIIRRLVDELDHSPRRWESIPLVSELAGFICQCSVAAMDSVKKLSHMARRWAEDTRRLWQRDGVSDAERKELRTRECILYGYAVLCYDFVGVESSSEVDVQVICELLVLFHNAKLFVAGDKASVVDAIQSKVDRMMADRVASITKRLMMSLECSQLLTGLCRCVDSSTPENLTWYKANVHSGGRYSSCFSAKIGDSDSYYLLNVFSGAIETDGSLPSGLPASIRQMPLYRRLFDDLDFEVTRRLDVYTTTRNIDESIRYRFRVHDGTGELVVEEHSPSATMQLCTEAWCKQFEAAFPRRLATLYAHWYWIDQGVVFLRLPRVLETQVHFVVKFDGAGRALCYEVPRPDWGLSYSQLVSRTCRNPVFVVASAGLLDVISKFEASEYVHVTRRSLSDKFLEVSLPRFGLQFRQDAQGRLVSLNHRGFVLSREQQLGSGQMPRFRQYLVLCAEDPSSGTKQRRLLIPAGPVETSNAGSATSAVRVIVSDDPSAVLPYSAIDEHSRLQVFTPDTIEARLQLAAIFAASDSLLPWEDLGMTGGEAALQLLRGSTPSRPLSVSATQCLVSIAANFAFRTPVLTLLVALLLDKSRRLGFLFDSDQSTSVAIDDALDEYRHRLSSSPEARMYPSRQYLSREEEWDLLGSAAASETLHSRTYRMHAGITTTPTIDQDPPVESSFVRERQLELASYVTQNCVVSGGSSDDDLVPAFPLSPPVSNAMGEQMVRELRESWERFHRHDSSSALALSAEEFLSRLRTMESLVRSKRESCWAYLTRTVDQARSSVTDGFLETMGRHGRLNVCDVMRSVLDENVVLQFAPSLGSSARKLWKRNCVCLLELCVLEDKIERIIAWHGSNRVLEELQTTVPSWESEKHPYWLVFEVEGRLQIRQEQYVIAKHLIENPGSICQLNMGRGKTRVILPMLFLYHSYCSRTLQIPSQLLRAHFLSPLLSETRDFMWRVLTSGVLQLPFIELPFNRSCSLGRRELRMMQHVLGEAKRNGAVVVVAPEHRLSLELKRVEMQSLLEADKPSTELRVLDDVLSRAQYVDIFDESDALLHHGYHLVYAVGASVALDGGSNRWLTAEAVLRVLVSDKSSRVQAMLREYPDVWSSRPEYLKRPGGTSGGGTFNGFQLGVLRSSDARGEVARQALKCALVEDLMDHAPFDLEWLRVFSADPGRRAALVRLLTDVTIGVDEAMQDMPPAVANFKQQVLALRGLLSFGVLENCLQKRYRVNYGHPTPGTRPKAIAIPYQAADLPAERSEFSHPDVGILLTLLSFYHSGLLDWQIRRTFEMLLSLDVSESSRYYGEWYDSIASSIVDARERQTLENLAHISLDNAHQFGMVCSTYRYAIEVVNFYLNFCVFPRDTRQFPSRLSRTAWDLVSGSKNIGFSGTNDTHALLPLAVSQREPDEPVLRGTNGKMVKLLLEATRGYELLESSDRDAESAVGEELSSTRACWQSLLLFAIGKKCDALIDTGALLAGVSNHEAAQFLVGLPGFAQQGVTYYDTRPGFDGWMVLVKARNLVQPHKTSSLRESDTFVVFDEARSRGSDMKLLAQATALLTLGPTITKDKLMQGAGRMRQLGATQQTIWLTSTYDVHTSVVHQKSKHGDGVTDPSGVSIVDVLSWVVDNTQRQCTLGLLEWAQSGVQYHAKEVDAMCELQADDWSLEGQYAGAQNERLISEIVEKKIATKMALVMSPEYPHAEPHAENDASETAMTDIMPPALQQIRAHGQLYGSQDAVCVTSLGEECERELQIEEEQQEERESIRHELDPCTERLWDVQLLLNAVSARDLGAARVLSLEEAASEWLQPRECVKIAWASCQIYGSASFWSTVQTRGRFASAGGFAWTSYLRRIHGMLFFPDGTTLLLSEREEDAVLAMLHAERLDDHPSEMRRGQFVFVQLPYITGFLRRTAPTVLAADSQDIPVSSLPLALGWDHGLPAVPETLTMPFAAVVACCLLNGDTDLFLDCHPTQAEAALRALLGPLRRREETLQAFISLRGFTARWKRSSLHAITKRLDLEDDSSRA